jgi:hypothetical protein
VKKQDEHLQARRKFLKSAGKLAVYTPPLMVALARPSFATVSASGGGCNNGLGQPLDCQPRGLLDKEHLWNDLPTSIPGNPNNNPNN